MKTKEVTVYASKDILSDWVGGEKIYKTEHESTPVRCRLVIDLPEKEIKLTESKLDEAWKEVFHACSDELDVKKLKQKLFGSEADVSERLRDNT